MTSRRGSISPVVALLGAGVLSGGRPGQSRAAGRSVDFPGRFDFSCCSAAHLLAGDSVCRRRSRGAEQGVRLCGFPRSDWTSPVACESLAWACVVCQAEAARGRAGVCSSVDFPKPLDFSRCLTALLRHQVAEWAPTEAGCGVPVRLLGRFDLPAWLCGDGREETTLGTKGHVCRIGSAGG